MQGDIDVELPLLKGDEHESKNEENQSGQNIQISKEGLKFEDISTNLLPVNDNIDLPDN